MDLSTGWAKRLTAGPMALFRHFKLCKQTRFSEINLSGLNVFGMTAEVGYVATDLNGPSQKLDHMWLESRRVLAVNDQAII